MTVTIMLAGHGVARRPLHKIAKALRQAEGSTTVDCYGRFPGDIAALRSSYGRFSGTDAFVLVMSRASRDERSDECLNEADILGAAMRANCACFLIGDQNGVSAPYLKQLGRGVTGVVTQERGQTWCAPTEMCPAAYELRLEDIEEGAAQIAAHILDILRSPGRILVS